MSTVRRTAGRGLLAVALGLVAMLGVLAGGYIVLSGGAADPASEDGNPSADGTSGAGDGAGNGSSGDGTSENGSTGGSRPTKGPRPNPLLPPEPGQPWFQFDDFGSQLNEVDWARVGELCGRIVPALANIGNDAARGDMVPDAAWIALDKMELEVAAILTPFSDANGLEPGPPTLVHPAIAANAIAGTLNARRRGLDVEQGQKLAALAREHVQLDASRVKELEEQNESFLQRLISQSRLRRRFFQAVDEILDDEQRRALHLPLVRGRCRIDLFSAGSCWFGMSEPLLAPTGPDGEDILPHLVAERAFMGMFMDDIPTTVEVCKRTLELMTPQELGVDANWLDRWGFGLAERVEWSAQWTEDLIRARMREEIDREPPKLPSDFGIRPVILTRDDGE